MNKVLKVVLVLLVLLALIPVIVVYAIKPVMFAGNSMTPNYKNGEYFLVNKLAYKFSKPQQGDVISFLAPPGHQTEFIKRIVGLPNEKIKVQDDSVYINDIKLSEPYLDNILTKEGGTIGNNDVLIPDGKYALLGDNRSHSLDSRNFGFISLEDITGKVLLCYFNCN